MLASFSLLALPLLAASSAVGNHARHNHDHEPVARALPGAWYHREDHPVHNLFRRGGDGANYPAVGSSEWSKGFPDGWSTPKSVPDAWTAALNDAVKRKAIPDIPIASVNHNLKDGDGVPTYPKGNDPNSPSVCSATYQCRIPGDIWDAPEGKLALSFDDGPTSASDDLLDFLAANKQAATHFMIGSAILDSPNQFTKTFNMDDDLAVHTWSHPYMTTMSNAQVVAEIGWTLQLIHNSTGGRIPRFWRPPYGDSDVRTSAIAKEVFGLATVIWNQDTSDWSLTDSPPGTSLSKINSSMTTWLTGKKSPGLVILEHELSTQSVQAFKSAYPVMKANSWDVESLSRLFGNGSAYWNAADNTGDATPVVNVVSAKNVAAPASGNAPSNGTSTGSNAGTNNQVANNNKSGASSPSASAPAPSTSGKSSAARSSIPAAAASLATIFLAAFSLAC